MREGQARQNVKQEQIIHIESMARMKTKDSKQIWHRNKNIGLFT